MLEDLLLRPVLTFLLRVLFRVEVRGVEHFHASGERVLIVSNHQSFLDPFLLAVLVPQKPAFAMNLFQAQKWYFRWIRHIIALYVLDPTKPLSMKNLIADLRKGAKVVIFPEGRITTSGGIMKIYDGAKLIVEKTGATVLPVHISGAEYCTFSRLGRKLRQRWFPKVTVTFGPPRRFEGELSSHALYDLMTQTAFEAANWRQPLLSAILDAADWHGGDHVVATDISREEMSYRQLFTRAFILAEKLNVILRHGEAGSAGSHATGRDPAQPLRVSQDDAIAMMLPNALGAAVTFVALHMLGKVPCMLNFSAGEANILHACRIACVKTVLTSRVFIEKAKLEHIALALEKECRVVYLEDIRPTVTLADKIAGLMKALQPRAELAKALAAAKPEDPAVILYTSGSEGAPKGVALSHANLLANIQQCKARLDLTPGDRLFNAMPVFHSFGLTVGMLMPLVLGIRTFLFPSPVQYRVIPEMVYDSDSTIMLGTDTFYNGYARYAHAYDFWSVRLAVAGAEKLREDTRRLWVDRFRVPIMQGYGVTEASPVVSFNTPLDHKPGTIGRAFPGIEWRIDPVEGHARGGRLVIKGPNVMLGYLKADRPGVIQPQGEWYDTGDIVEADAEGFISILGRAKRFAKIAGEMVSLLAVEELAQSLLPELGHAAVSVADARKGEQIILYTESAELTRDRLVAQAKIVGVADIALPKQVLFMQAIPRLGSGKIDYPALAKIAQSNPLSREAGEG